MDASGPTPRDAGLSLIEVMVVVAIVSILSAGSLFLLTRPGLSPPDWQRLTQAYQSQRVAAVTGAKPMALEITQAHWIPQIWDGRDADAPWTNLDEPRPWAVPPSGANSLPVRVVFLPTGRASGLELRLPRADGTTALCRADQWEALSCAAR